MFRALSLLCLLWGFNWVVMKVANEFFSPSFFAMLRFSTGAAILLMVTVIKQYAIMLALSAAMVWAAGNVAMKGKLMGCDLTSLTAWQMTIGAVVLAVYNVFIGDWYAEWNTLSIACIAYNGALASAVAFLLWCYLIKHMEASKAAISSLAVPVVGIVSGIVFLGESLTLAMGMGMLLVFAGIVLAQKG